MSCHEVDLAADVFQKQMIFSTPQPCLDYKYVQEAGKEISVYQLPERHHHSCGCEVPPVLVSTRLNSWFETGDTEEKKW